MARRYLFLDESGNFDFSSRGSRYFTLTSVGMTDCKVGDQLTELRRELAWREVHLRSEFHATEDAQATRDLVFGVIGNHDLQIDATILEKCKTVTHLRANPQRFYKQALYMHLKHVIPRFVEVGDEILVVCATLGTKKQLESHFEDLIDVLDQMSIESCPIRGALWPAAAEPCLQVADYCCWAIHRKWERRDTRSYDLISLRIRTEFEAFKWGAKKYY